MSAGTAPNAVAADVQSKQWHLDLMNAEGMWKFSTGKGIKVAVVDTGVHATTSLKGQVLTDEAFGSVDDYDGHGTTMAELIAGTGVGGGLRGLAPDAKVVPYRVHLLGLPEGEKAPSSADGIRAAADSDARIISMSFGGDYYYPDVEEAIKYAHAKGKLMFASTGNDAEKKNFIGYPAAYPYVVGVAAADESGRVGDFSEYGNYVDLAAPGLNLPAWCDDTFRSYCDGAYGTSQATAIASASAALIWSAHPDWTANQVLRTLIDTAGRDWPKDKPSKYLGYGLVRPNRVLQNSAINPGPANADPLSYQNGTGVTGLPASASPSASAQQGHNKTSGGSTSAAGASTNTSDVNTPMWAGLGAAVVLAVGGAAFVALRKRRST
jgi:hypothetical protein